uniref:Uncharacterized protein n=1 Tax=Anguilla anguilla TaxID=7936 RepID=A0A0E9RRG0_ANGAN
MYIYRNCTKHFTYLKFFNKAFEKCVTFYTSYNWIIIILTF